MSVDKPSERPGPRPRPSRLDWLRWSIVLIWTVAVLSVFVGSLLFDVGEVSRDQASGGKVLVTHDPLDWTELAPFLIVPVLLLLPDMSELGFLGFNLKRKVEAQERRQDTVEQRLASVEVSTTQSQRQSVQVLVDTRGLEQQLPAKDSAFLQYAIPPQRLAPARSQASTDLERQLLEAWERLRPYVDVVDRAGATRPPRLPDVTNEQVQVLRRWNSIYQSDIETIRAGRNAVAHPPHYLTDDTLRDLVDLAEHVLDTARRGLQEFAGGDIRDD